jgi:hypothetical protein
MELLHNGALHRGSRTKVLSTFSSPTDEYFVFLYTRESWK